MDLFKLLNNPMQQMMGNELGNIFQRLGSSGNQQPMMFSPSNFDPFGQDMMMQGPPEQSGNVQLFSETPQGMQAMQESKNRRKQEVAPYVAPILEGFAPEEAEDWMDAFVDAIDTPDDEAFADNDFLKTVMAEVGPENQEEFKDILRHLKFNPYRDDPGGVMGDIAEGMQDELMDLSEEEQQALVEQEFQKEALGYETQFEDALDRLTDKNQENLFQAPREENEAIADEELQPQESEDDIPQGVSFDKMKAAEQNAAAKHMREEASKAQKLVKSHDILKKMKTLIAEHPNMSRDMAAAFIDPSETPTFAGQIARRFANPKDLAAYEKFTKLSNDLVLQAGEALGSRNFTDAKMRLIQASKPSGRMTDESLNYVIDHMMHDWEPAQAYNEAIEKARLNRVYPRMDMEYYRGKGKKQQSLEDLSEEELEKLLNG